VGFAQKSTIIQVSYSPDAGCLMLNFELCPLLLSYRVVYRLGVNYADLCCNHFHVPDLRDYTRCDLYVQISLTLVYCLGTSVG